MAQRRARLAELKKKMDQERSRNEDQDFPEQMQIIARAQVLNVDNEEPLRSYYYEGGKWNGLDRGQ